MCYTLILILNKIIQTLFIMILVFLTYPATKNIVKKNLKIELEAFHSKYIQNNYHLDIANLNSLDKLNEAIVYIKSEPDFFDRIPGEDILTTTWYLSFLNKYDLQRKRILSIIGITMSIELGIKIGLSFL